MSNPKPGTTTIINKFEELLKLLELHFMAADVVEFEAAFDKLIEK